MWRMISARRSSVWEKVQESREAFCCISRALVATPPALAALPGAKATPASWRTRTASGVVGMLAPSATAFTPLRTRASASASWSSFWVAQGRATSQGTFQTPVPGTYLTCSPRRSAYSETRPR